jgi:hypothetical protein
MCDVEFERHRISIAHRMVGRVKIYGDGNDVVQYPRGRVQFVPAYADDPAAEKTRHPVANLVGYRQHPGAMLNPK